MLQQTEHYEENGRDEGSYASIEIISFNNFNSKSEHDMYGHKSKKKLENYDAFKVNLQE